MATGRIADSRNRLKRPRVAVFATFLLMSSLTFSPIVLANQTPVSEPVVPPSVEDSLPEKPSEDDPAPDPNVPDTPPSDDPAPGESETSPETDVPAETDDPVEPNLDDASESTDPGETTEEGGGEEGVSDTDESDPGEADTEEGDTDGEPEDDSVENDVPGDESTENEADPELTENSDGTDEPASDDDIPAATPTEEPTPTEAPVPIVTWNQSEPVSCELHDGSAAELAFNESSTYRCAAIVNVSSEGEMPVDMQIQWQVDLDFPDAYSVGLPESSQAAVVSQTSGATATSTQIVYSHPWQAESAAQTLEFDVVLTRTTCVVGEQVLTVQATPMVSTRESEAEVVRADGNVSPQPTQIVSEALSSETPHVAFSGPITFEPLSATARGLESEISRGTATIVVTGEWDPCTTWTVNMSGSIDVPAETPASFRVVSINGEAITGDACDLSTQCDLFVLPEFGDAAVPHTYTIGLELQLNEFTPVGDFGISLTSNARGEESQP